MTLRRRLALVSAIAVAVAIVAASAIVFFVVRAQLRDQVDSSLREMAAGATVMAAPVPPPSIAGTTGQAVELVPARRARHRDGGKRHHGNRSDMALALPEQQPGAPPGFGQVIGAGGQVFRPAQDGVAVPPVTAAAAQVASGERRPFFEDADVQGTHLRVLTAPIGGGQAVQVARSLEETDSTLSHLAIVLIGVALGGIALAAVLGRAVSMTAIAPVAKLTDAAEHVARTRDLQSRIEVAREDEIGRLAASFNSMLAELEGAVASQRQLVADASHELRTPLTSLRTNIETLARPNGMPETDRRRLLADVVAQLEELSALVGNLVDLARDEQPDEVAEDLRFDELVAEAAVRAGRHAPDRSFAVELEPCLVHGVAHRLDRAVANLLDNAAKWSPPRTEVEVSLSAEGELAVRDHGPGIDPGDLPHVFDRFYRAVSARALAGSGLGLAIVRQVAEAHGGSVEAATAPGGGTVMRLCLPVLETALEPAAALS